MLFVFKIDIALLSDWEKMDVGMGDFQSDDRNGNPFAFDFCFQLTSDFLGKYHQVCQLVIFQIKKVIILFFRHYQRMTFDNRIDVQKCVMLIILGYLIAGNLSVNDFCKNSSHIAEIN